MRILPGTPQYSRPLLPGVQLACFQKHGKNETKKNKTELTELIISLLIDKLETVATVVLTIGIGR